MKKSKLGNVSKSWNKNQTRKGEKMKKESVGTKAILSEVLQHLTPAAQSNMCLGKGVVCNTSPLLFPYKYTQLLLAIACTKIPKMLISLSLSLFSSFSFSLLFSRKHLSKQKLQPLFYHFHTSKALR